MTVIGLVLGLLAAVAAVALPWYGYRQFVRSSEAKRLVEKTDREALYALTHEDRKWLQEMGWQPTGSFALYSVMTWDARAELAEMTRARAAETALVERVNN